MKEDLLTRQIMGITDHTAHRPDPIIQAIRNLQGRLTIILLPVPAEAAIHLLPDQVEVAVVVAADLMAVAVVRTAAEENNSC